jgi:hypothetical protein
LIFVAVIAIGVVGSVLKQLGLSNDPSPQSPKEQAKDQVGLAWWSWRKESFGVMEADFVITNGSSYDIKDIKIRCDHYAKSGTRIDSNTRTIYDVIKAGETKEFTKFNMGFIHSQAASSSASIQDFAIAP